MIKTLLGKLHVIAALPEKNRYEAVILIHGLLLRGLYMRRIGVFLARNGYTVFIYDYFTSRKKIAGHGADFERYLENIASENPSLKINIVTHSLGGIITREALGRIDAGNSFLKDRIKRIVMLVPPNRGSDLAKAIIRHFPFLGKFIKPLPELSSSPDAYVMKTYIPSDYETGIIAASRDTKVSEKSTHLESEKDHTMIISGHSLIIFSRQAQKAILNFLENGSF
ncbi:MAG: hypothetical protein A2017_21240 [Lentisphaerae bacterium GWF2_44_16]|nr:MAG: hypothetical protein A2017_21240 [Lentisphaerae bacterium GWF2_44_16]